MDKPELSKPSLWRFLKEVFWRPLSLLWVVPWFFISNSDTICEKIIKPVVAKWESLKWWVAMTQSIPMYVWVILTLIVIVFQVGRRSYVMYRAAQNQAIREATEFESYLKPRLEVSHDPADSDLMIFDNSIPSNRVRVKVKNISGTTVDDVLVQLIKVDPPGMRGVLSIPLLHMHWRGKTLNPDDWLLVDAFYKDSRENFVDVTHGVKKLNDRRLTSLAVIPARTVWIQASGRNCQKSCGIFTLYCLDDGLISLRQVDKP